VKWTSIKRGLDARALSGWNAVAKRVELRRHLLPSRIGF
jgi:hypothetical protein